MGKPFLSDIEAVDVYLENLYINDTNTQIWEDVSGNLSFKDANAGTKTLTELAAGNPSFGAAQYYIPYTNSSTDDFDYSSNFYYNGSQMFISSILSITSSGSNPWTIQNTSGNVTTGHSINTGASGFTTTFTAGESSSTTGTHDGGALTLRGGNQTGTGGGDGGDVLIYGGTSVTGTRGQIYLGDGSTFGTLQAKGSETNVVYYDSATGKLSYGAVSGGDVTASTYTNNDLAIFSATTKQLQDTGGQLTYNGTTFQADCDVNMSSSGNSVFLFDESASIIYIGDWNGNNDETYLEISAEASGYLKYFSDLATLSFHIDVNGNVYFPTITGTGTGTSMLYYNRTTGEVTYGDAPGGGSGITGSGVVNRVATWSGSSTLSYENYFYSSGTVALLGTTASYDPYSATTSFPSRFVVAETGLGKRGSLCLTTNVTSSGYGAALSFMNYNGGSGTTDTYDRICQITTYSDSANYGKLHFQTYESDGWVGRMILDKDQITFGTGGTSTNFFITHEVTTASTGNSITVESGEASSSYATGGHLYLRGGEGSGSYGYGGNLYIRGGTASAQYSTGGSVYIINGYNSYYSSYAGGDIYIGYSGSTRTGGATYIYSDSSGHTLIVDQDGSAGEGIRINLDSTSTADDFITAYQVSTVVANLDATGVWYADDFDLDSDPRLKNILEIPVKGLDIVKKLDPIKFTWKDNRNDFEHIGFSSTNVKEIRPELVHTKKNGYEAMSYGKVSAINTSAIKELLEEVETLKDKIKELEDGNRT